ncbi:MAG: hypothetical protein ABJE95_14585 [Byssovorax sp.]
MPSPEPPFAPPAADADEAFRLAFQEWECLCYSVVAVAVLCADAWTEGETSIADCLDRLCKVTSNLKAAEAAIKLLDEAAGKHPRAP